MLNMNMLNSLFFLHRSRCQQPEYNIITIVTIIIIALIIIIINNVNNNLRIGSSLLGKYRVFGIICNTGHGTKIIILIILTNK